MERILVLGGFGYRTESFNGQAIKTRNVLALLKQKEKEENIVVDFFDTIEVRFNKLSMMKLMKMVWNCDVLIYLPAHNNLKYFFPLVYFLSKIRKFPIIYIVIGGWLADFIKTKPLHQKMLKNLKCILPETILLKERLEREYNINNAIVFQNFRIQHFKPQIYDTLKDETLKLVFMSRINKMKGYEMIFEAADYIEQNKLKVKIDFFGPIHDTDKDDFFSNVGKFDFVRYLGVLDPESIYETLSNYDILLLPTKYYTEGLPGAIVDAYISGIPVIVTKWLHAHEFVNNGETGYIVPFTNGKHEFIEKILDLYNDREKLNEFKRKALKKSSLFSVDYAWETLKPLIAN